LVTTFYNLKNQTAVWHRDPVLQSGLATDLCAETIPDRFFDFNGMKTYHLCVL